MIRSWCAFYHEEVCEGSVKDFILGGHFTFKCQCDLVNYTTTKKEHFVNFCLDLAEYLLQNVIGNYNSSEDNHRETHYSS